MTEPLIALDLFAGTGWGVACDWLGIAEFGVDNMQEVVDTRKANGMPTIFRDVWTGLLSGLSGGIEIPSLNAGAIQILQNYNLLIASPPCQTFSQAGAGSGREALDQVLVAVTEGRYKVPENLYKLGDETDARTALVLTPLAYAYRDRPMYVVLEQVPPVLPVWEACAVELREIGYSVVTGLLHAEQYGVPQTRKRAILIARRDGVEATMPVPTHSKYYNRDPKRLDEGVEKWVSMAEALGWGTTAKPSYTVTGGGADTGGAEPFGNGSRIGMAKAMEEGNWEPRDVSLNSNVRFGHGTVRTHDQPAPTITGAKDYEDRQWVLRSNYGTNGDPAARGERTQDAPAATITSKADRNFWVEEREESEQWKWKDTPSTTVAGDPRITAREHHYHGEQNSTSFRLELHEAATLQSYPPMEWVGTKGRRFLMVGNAVPPVLARAILETLLS